MPNRIKTGHSIAVSYGQSDLSCVIPEQNYRTQSKHLRSDSKIVEEIFAQFGYVRKGSPVNPFNVIPQNRHKSFVIVQDLASYDEQTCDEDNDSISGDFGHKPKLTLSFSDAGWSTVSGSLASPKHEEEINALTEENDKLREELETLRRRNAQLEEENGLLQTTLSAAIKSKELMMATVSDAFNHVRDKFMGQ